MSLVNMYQSERENTHRTVQRLGKTARRKPLGSPRTRRGWTRRRLAAAPRRPQTRCRIWPSRALPRPHGMRPIRLTFEARGPDALSVVKKQRSI